MIERDWPAGLLVSVRDAFEAALAVAGGAAIIDVKEPARGPLGRSPAATAAAAAAAVGQTPLTLAMGELAGGVAGIVASLAEMASLLPAGCPLPRGVKAGPEGMPLARWLESFAGLARQLPAGIEPVAVAYADWQTAAAPPPAELAAAAAAAGGRALLIDTFDKRGPGLFQLLGHDGVAALVESGRRLRLAVALAGRLNADEVAASFALGARIVGVRSAVCGGDRQGRLLIDRVRDLATLQGRQ